MVKKALPLLVLLIIISGIGSNFLDKSIKKVGATPTEQILNGGFESGFSGWSNDSPFVSISNFYHYSGSNSCHWIYDVYAQGFISQPLNVTVSGISSFTCYLKKLGGESGINNTLKVEISYAIHPTSIYIFPQNSTGYDWTLFDLKSLIIIPDGYTTDTVIAIEFIFTGTHQTNYYLDDVSCIAEGYIPPPHVYTTLPWHDGFEGGLGNWTTQNGQPFYTSTNWSQDGTHSLLIGTLTQIQHTFTGSINQTDVWFDWYVYATHPASYCETDWKIKNTDGDTIARVHLLSNSGFALYVLNTTSDNYIGYTPKVNANTTYKVSLHIKIGTNGNHDGSVILYIDDYRYITASNLENYIVAGNKIDRAWIGVTDIGYLNYPLYMDNFTAYTGRLDTNHYPSVGDITTVLAPISYVSNSTVFFTGNVTTTYNTTINAITILLESPQATFPILGINTPTVTGGKNWITTEYYDTYAYYIGGSLFYGQLIQFNSVNASQAMVSGDTINFGFSAQSPNSHGSYLFNVSVYERGDLYPIPLDSDIITTTDTGGVTVIINPPVAYISETQGYGIRLNNQLGSEVTNFTVTFPSGFNCTQILSHKSTWYATVGLNPLHTKLEYNGTIDPNDLSYVYIKGYPINVGTYNWNCTVYTNDTAPYYIYGYYTVLPLETNHHYNSDLTDISDWGLGGGEISHSWMGSPPFEDGYGLNGYAWYDYGLNALGIQSINPTDWNYIYKYFNTPLYGYNVTFSFNPSTLHIPYDYTLFTSANSTGYIQNCIEVNRCANGTTELILLKINPPPQVFDSYPNLIDYNATQVINLGTLGANQFVKVNLLYHKGNSYMNVTINGAIKGEFDISNSIIDSQKFIFGDVFQYLHNGGSWEYTWGEGRVNYANISINELAIPTFLNVTINGRTYDPTHTGYEWIFKDDVYQLRAYYQYASIISLNFTDSIHTVFFNYNNNTKKGELSVLNADGTWKNENVANGLSCNTTVHNNSILETDWKFQTSDNIIDIFNTTLKFTVSDTVTTITGNTGVTFNLYNVGGMAQYAFTPPDGLIVLGGSPLQVSAQTNPASASAWLIYRRLQYYHTLAELSTDSKQYGQSFAHQESCGELEFEFDYKLVDKENQAWIEGLRAEVTLVPNGMNVGDYSTSPDSSVVEYTVDWYNRGVFVRQDKMYSYDYGYASWISDAPESVTDQFPTGRRSIPFWVDLWFDNSNGSKVIGGRINSQYYGEYESGSSWWFGYAGFQPKISNTTASMAFVDLIDGSNNTISSQQVSLVRIKTTLRKVNNGTLINGFNGDDDKWSMLPYQYVSTKIAPDRMIGIDTPTFVETQEVKMKGYTVFDPVTAILGSLGSIISSALFGVMKAIIGSIDTILTWVGLPYGTFSSLISFFSNIFSSLIGSLVSIISMTSKALMMITMFVTTFVSFVDYIISAILFFGIDIFSVPIQIIALFMAVLNGGTMVFYGIPLDFTMYQPLMVALKTLLPPFGGIFLTIWVLWGNLDMRGEPDMIEASHRVIQLFGMVAELYNNITWMFNRIRNELITIYNFIRSHIPTIGSGGGETSEASDPMG